MKIYLATHNQDKLNEFRELLGDRLEIQPLPTDFPPIEENGTSYEANAEIKARAVYEALGAPVLADDSGLSVDALDGYPGIYSARFAGADAAYPDKISKLWGLLAKTPPAEWGASFICALCLIDEAGRAHHFRGEVRGLIWPELRGTHGFGYDPIFYLPERQMTTAELSPEAKNEISHRGLAVQKLLTYLEDSGLIEPME